MEKFCYLNSTLSNEGILDVEVTQHIAKASGAFSMLAQRLLQECGIKLQTKIAVNKTVIMSVLLYCCETRTLYHHHIQWPEQFNHHCLCSICSIKSQDRVSNLHVLEKYGLPSIEYLHIHSQLWWTSHVLHMEGSKIPKMLLYRQLKDGHCNQEQPFKCYKEFLKENLKTCGIDIPSWEETPKDQSLWRQICSCGLWIFKADRAGRILSRRENRKQGSALLDSFPCSVCRPSCTPHIGLQSYMRTHSSNFLHLPTYLLCQRETTSSSFW